MTPSGFLPRLPRPAWIVLSGDAVSALGTGLVLPFLVVYLRDVRDLSVATAGLVVSTMAVVSLAVGPTAGSAIDRFGARRMLLAALVLASTGSLALASVAEPWHAFVAAGIIGAAFAALWPASHSLLTGLVSPSQRSAVYSVHYATLNAGIGLGGIAGGLIADTGDPSTFEMLYRIDALSWLVFAVILVVMRRAIPSGAGGEEEAVSGGYREVFADRSFVRLLVIALALVTIGYSQLESGFPAYATGSGGISTRVLGAAFAVNTFVIVAGQFPILRLVGGRRRTRAMAVICLLWAAAWLITAGAGQIDAQTLRNLTFVVALGVFALGECLVSPTIPAIINDLASDRLRGRYNAAYSVVFSGGHIVGPALAGFLLEAGAGPALFLGLTGCCFATLGLIRGLERRLPDAANVAADDELQPEGSTGDSVLTV